MIKKITLACFLFSSLFVAAQDTTVATSETKSSSWSYLVQPYLMFPNMKGDTQIRENLPSLGIDANTSDIFNNLEMGAMLYLEARNADWAITSDFVYMKLGQDATPDRLVEKADIDVTETIWELAGFRRFLPMLEAGVGMRLVSIGAEANIDLVTGESHNPDLTETWVDPIIIVRSNHVIKDKFIANIRADIGGFGIGSKLTWQLQGEAGYQFSDLFSASLGYRYISIDYVTGSGQDYFVYDVDTFGPELRLGFNF
ncbi:hypothetical protein [Formosa sp. PL04]|uniref:hypothetical protein n=1 Tax=Formosa sp. PL04 TaxID=3081755 RepID=UPI0029812CB9|nr:hypothetical protein [Formosa sp. PL04]MDW5290908.1 hypothetical protein [Formosa sp. PL04]